LTLLIIRSIISYSVIKKSNLANNGLFRIKKQILVYLKVNIQIPEMPPYDSKSTTATPAPVFESVYEK